jgi:hypothetical protein
MGNAKPGATFAAKLHVVLSHHEPRIGSRLTEANEEVYPILTAVP